MPITFEPGYFKRLRERVIQCANATRAAFLDPAEPEANAKNLLRVVDAVDSILEYGLWGNIRSAEQQRLYVGHLLEMVSEKFQPNQIKFLCSKEACDKSFSPKVPGEHQHKHDGKAAIFEHAFKFTGWHDEQFLPQRITSLFYILVTLQKKKITEYIEDEDTLAENLIQAITQGMISFTLVRSREADRPQDYIDAIRHCPEGQSVAISAGWPGHQIYFEAFRRGSDHFEYFVHNRGGGTSGNHLILPDDDTVSHHAKKVRTFVLGVFPLENDEVKAHVMAIGNRHISKTETIKLLYDTEGLIASEKIDVTAGAGAGSGASGGGLVTSSAGTRLVDLPVQHGGHCVFDSHSAFLARFFDKDFLQFVLRQELVLLMVRQRSLAILKAILLANPIHADKTMGGFAKHKHIHMGGVSPDFEKELTDIVWDEEEDVPAPVPLSFDWAETLKARYAELKFQDVFGDEYDFVDHRYWHDTIGDTGQKETIKCRAANFLKHLKENRQPVVLAEAPMGFGKTSTQKHLAKLWASDTEAGKALREQYQHCLLIPLGNITSSKYKPHEMTIAHVVARECLGKTLSEMDLARMMIHLTQSKVLWLFDGLDEFNLPKEQWPDGLASILENTVDEHQVIVTGRPDRIIDLNLAAVWRIQPFNVGQIKKMVRQKLNYDQVVTLLDYFKLNLSDYQEVKGGNTGYLSTPLCLQMVVKIVKKGGLKFGRSLTMFDLFFEIEAMLEKKYLERRGVPDGFPVEMLSGLLQPMRQVLGELALSPDNTHENLPRYRDELNTLGVVRVSEDYQTVLFHHPSYESYYIARFCFELVKRNPATFADFIRAHRYRPRYRDVWPMFIGLCLKSDDAARLEWCGIFFEAYLNHPRDLFKIRAEDPFSVNEIWVLAACMNELGLGDLPGGIAELQKQVLDFVKLIVLRIENMRDMAKPEEMLLQHFRTLVVLKQKITSSTLWAELEEGELPKMIARFRYVPDHFLPKLRLKGFALGYCHDHSVEFGALTPQSKAAFVKRLTDRLSALAEKEGVSRDESFEEFYVCWALVQMGEVSDQIISLLTIRVLQPRYDGDQPPIDSLQELLNRCFNHYIDRDQLVPQEAVDRLYQRFDQYKEDSFEWGDQESYSHRALIDLLYLVLKQCPEGAEAWLESSLKLFWSVPDGDEPYDFESDGETECSPEFSLLEIQHYLCIHVRYSFDYIERQIQRILDAGKASELVALVFRCLFQATKRQTVLSFSGGPHLEPVCAQREASELLKHLYQSHRDIFDMLIEPFNSQPYLEKHPAIIIAQCDLTILVRQYFSQLAAGAGEKASNCLKGVAIFFKGHADRFEAIYIDDQTIVVAGQVVPIPNASMIQTFVHDFEKALLATGSYTLEPVKTRSPSAGSASTASVLSGAGYDASDSEPGSEADGEEVKEHS